MRETILLALETSTRNGSVALRNERGEIFSASLRTERRHDDDLLPAIDRVCTEAGVRPGDLGAVAVSVGPGGFTGLRIAITTVKMLGETLGVHLLAVPSAVVAAESYLEGGPILVALASKRESCWATMLERSDEGWSICGEPGIRDVAALDLSGIRILLADRFLPEDIRGRCKREGVRVEEPIFTATACLACGSRLLNQGCWTDALHLAPLYPRPPEAATLWQRRQSSHKGG